MNLMVFQSGTSVNNESDVAERIRLGKVFNKVDLKALIGSVCPTRK